jgi:hypothetical protein
MLWGKHLTDWRTDLERFCSAHRHLIMMMEAFPKNSGTETELPVVAAYPVPV